MGLISPTLGLSWSPLLWATSIKAREAGREESHFRSTLLSSSLVGTLSQKQEITVWSWARVCPFFSFHQMESCWIMWCDSGCTEAFRTLESPALAIATLTRTDGRMIIRIQSKETPLRVYLDLFWRIRRTHLRDELFYLASSVCPRATKGLAMTQILHWPANRKSEAITSIITTWTKKFRII